MPFLAHLADTPSAFTRAPMTSRRTPGREPNGHVSHAPVLAPAQLAPECRTKRRQWFAGAPTRKARSAL